MPTLTEKIMKTIKAFSYVVTLSISLLAQASVLESPIQVKDAFNFTDAWTLSETQGPPFAVALHTTEGRDLNLTGLWNQPLERHSSENPASGVSFLNCRFENLVINGSRISKDAPWAGKEAYTQELIVSRIKSSRKARPYNILVNKKRYASDASIRAYLQSKGYASLQDNGQEVQLFESSQRVAAPETHAYHLESSDKSVTSVLSCVAWVQLKLDEGTSTQDFKTKFEATSDRLKKGLRVRDFNSLTVRLQDGSTVTNPPFRYAQPSVIGDLILSPR